MGQCCARPAGAPDWQNKEKEMMDVKSTHESALHNNDSRMPSAAPLDRSTKDAILERLHQGELLVESNNGGPPRGGQRTRHGSAGRFPPMNNVASHVNPAGDPFMPSYLAATVHEATYEPITVHCRESLAVPEPDKRLFSSNGGMPDHSNGSYDTPDEWNKPVDKRAMVVSYGPSGLATVTEESESNIHSRDRTPLASTAAAQAERVVVKSVVLTKAMPGASPVDPLVLEAKLAALEREASLQYEGEDLVKGRNEGQLAPGHWSAEDLVAKGWGVAAAHRRWGSNVSDVEVATPDGKKPSQWNVGMADAEEGPATDMLWNSRAGVLGAGGRAPEANHNQNNSLPENFNWEYQTNIDHSNFHRLSKEDMRIAFGEFTPGVITPYILTPGSSFSLPQHMSVFPNNDPNATRSSNTPVHNSNNSIPPNLPSANSPMRRHSHRRSSSFSNEPRSGEAAAAGEFSRFAGSGASAMSPHSRA